MISKLDPIESKYKVYALPFNILTVTFSVKVYVISIVYLCANSPLVYAPHKMILD